jgi:hypothetical protein
VASETMESAIAEEVAYIKRELGKINLSRLGRWDRERIVVIRAKCDNIQRTLEEGDPEPYVGDSLHDIAYEQGTTDGSR